MENGTFPQQCSNAVRVSVYLLDCKKRLGVVEWTIFTLGRIFHYGAIRIPRYRKCPYDMGVFGRRKYPYSRSALHLDHSLVSYCCREIQKKKNKKCQIN